MTEPSPSVPEGFFLGSDRRLRPLWRAVWFVSMAFLGFFLTAPWVGYPSTWQGRKLQVIAAYTVLDAALVLVSRFLLRKVDGRSFCTLGLWFYRGWGRELILGAGTGTCMVILVVGSMAGGHMLRYQGANGSGLSSALGVAELAIILFLAAAAEELAFRGYGFQRLVDSIGPLWATAAFSTIFGVAHLLNPSATALSAAGTVLVGILLSVAYLKTRALWLPIGLHWAWNFFLGPIFSLPVSGVTFPGELLSPDISGSGWLNGGGYGPEGGVLAIAVYALAVAWVWRSRQIGVSPGMQEVLK